MFGPGVIAVGPIGAALLVGPHVFVEGPICAEGGEASCSTAS
jgi:hypothetical protein